MSGYRIDNLPILDNGSTDNRNIAKWKRHGKSKKVALVFIGTALIFFLGGIFGLHFQPTALQPLLNKTGFTPGVGTERSSGQTRTNRDASLAAETVSPVNQLVAIGRLIPQNDIITIAPPFGANDARVAQVLAEEGTRLAAGDPIAILDNAGQLEADLEQAHSRVAVKLAELDQVKAEVRSREQQAMGDAQKAKANLNLAQQDLIRGNQLQAKGIITAADLDKLRASVEQAEADILKSTALVSRHRASDGKAQSDVALARQNLELSKAELKSAELNLHRSKVLTPIDGTVLKIHTKVGEKPGLNGIATLGNTDQMQAELEIFQSDIHRVELTQTVSITSPALGNRHLAGKISQIGLEVKRQQLVENDPAANTDARVIRVRVALDEASSVLASRLTGLQITARISLDDK